MKPKPYSPTAFVAFGSLTFLFFLYGEIAVAHETSSPRQIALLLSGVLLGSWVVFQSIKKKSITWIGWEVKGVPAKIVSVFGFLLAVVSTFFLLSALIS